MNVVVTKFMPPPTATSYNVLLEQLTPTQLKIFSEICALNITIPTALSNQPWTTAEVVEFLGVVQKAIIAQR